MRRILGAVLFWEVWVNVLLLSVCYADGASPQEQVREHVSSADRKDGCFADVPEDLKAKLRRQFPQLRFTIGVVSEKEFSSAITINLDKEGCHSVASGDFNGDGKKDFALLMAEGDDTDAALVAAIRVGHGWQIERLPLHCGVTANCFVASGRRGKYNHVETYNSDPKDRFQRSSINAIHGVVRAGANQGYAVFAFLNGGWVGTPVTD